MFLELLTNINEYIDNNITLDELRNWIAANVLLLVKDPNSQEAKIIAQIEGIINDKCIEGYSDNEIKQEIQSLLTKIDRISLIVSWGVDENSSVISNSSTSMNQVIEKQLDISRELSPLTSSKWLINYSERQCC